MSGLYGYDNSFRREGCGRVAGIDEAGRGPIAGPVVAACVVLPEDTVIRGLKDSKLIPPKDIGRIFEKVIGCALDIGVGISSVDIIESINIYQATKLAMRQAVSHLGERPGILLIDAVKLPELDIRQVSIIKGELKSASIAAASVVAKYVRDRLMLHYHGIYPEYGFDQHKGYCTKEHLDRVAKFGPCPLHRKTFNGVMTMKLPF
ncbi:MAG: ribonuclease HII [Nitrospiraceae bacterium]|nr:ribonuclease HII [Nitrospiraceae bacterium]